MLVVSGEERDLIVTSKDGGRNQQLRHRTPLYTTIEILGYRLPYFTFQTDKEGLHELSEERSLKS